MKMVIECKNIGAQVSKLSNVGSDDTNNLLHISECSMMHCESFPWAADPGCVKLYPNHSSQMETAGSLINTQVACIERLSLSLASASKSSILLYQEVDITSL
jgi:hypothetical protein